MLGWKEGCYFSYLYPFFPWLCCLEGMTVVSGPVLVQEATSQLEHDLKLAPSVDGDNLMGWQLRLQSQTVAVDEAWSAWLEWVRVQQEESELGQLSSPDCISVSFSDDIQFRLVGFLAGTATPVKCLERSQAWCLGFDERSRLKTWRNPFLREKNKRRGNIPALGEDRGPTLSCLRGVGGLQAHQAIGGSVLCSHGHCYYLLRIFPSALQSEMSWNFPRRLHV